MEAGLRKLIEIGLGVIALVEDECDMRTGGGEGAIPVNQLVNDRAELRGIGDIAAIDHVEQRDVEIGGGHHTKADLAQVIAFLFVMATLGDGAVGTGIDVGVKIGGVIDQAVEVEFELDDESVQEVVFDGPQRVWGEAMHMVPEGL